MSYKRLIEAKTRQAFELVKDLAQDVVFTRKTNSDFNFGTGLEESDSKSVKTKVIVSDNKKKSSERNTIRKTLMAKTAEVGDMKLYESISFNGLVWKIGEVSKNDGYVSVVDVYREG